jgi:hypothetical protein
MLERFSREEVGGLIRFYWCNILTVLIELWVSGVMTVHHGRK